MQTRVSLFAVLAAVLAACGGADSGTGTPNTDGTPVPASVVISAPAQTVAVGQSLQLQASARDQAGNPITSTVSWSTSAANVATVSDVGVVTGVSPGTATITARATVNGASASVGTQIVVTAPAAAPVLTSVGVTAPAASVVIGGTLQLTAAPRDQNGSAIAASVSWLSSALGIATVNSTGRVTANATGSAIITAIATAGGVTVSADFVVTVSPVPLVLTSVTITVPASALRAGATLQLTAAPKDQDGNPIAASVAWGTSDQAKATVSSTGVVTGVAAGTVTITAIASAAGVIVSNSIQLTVLPPLVLTAVIITPSPVPEIESGTTVQLSASPRDQNNDPIAATVTWSTLDAAVATVSTMGLVTGVATGSVTIAATATAGGVTVMGTAAITVAAAPVLTSVIVTGSGSVSAGGTTQLMASPRDQFSNVIAAAISWGTSDGSKATVSGTGLVTGVAAGTATITATATAGPVMVLSGVTVTVTAGFPLSASVTATNGTAFTPASVDIARTGMVTWTFLSLTHNVSFSDPGAPGGIGNSMNTSVSLTFNTAGTFGYVCTLHGGMDGTVVVHP